MFRPELSSFLYHLFVSAKLSCHEPKLFICKLLNEKIGTVRADWCGEYYEMSLTMPLEFRGKGLASQMVSLIFQKLKGLVRAEFKVSNKPSIKIANSLNMKLINTIKGVHHFEIIID